MNIVYLFLTHKNPAIVTRTISLLQSPSARFFVHVDAASTADFSALKAMDNVYFPQKRIAVQWGGFSQIEAMLLSLSEIVRLNLGDFVLLLSEADYPVKSRSYIEQYIASNYHDFIQGYSLPSSVLPWQEGGRRKLECYALRLRSKMIATIEPRVLDSHNLRQLAKVLLGNPLKLPKALQILLSYPCRRHPHYIKPFGGEFWFGLRTSTISMALQFISEHRDYLQYMVHTQNPDEILMHSLVHHLVAHDEITHHTLRKVSWKSGCGNSPADILTSDTEWLNAACSDRDSLFVRKVQCLDVCNAIDSMVSGIQL